MPLPVEKKNLTVQEAADVLNVRRERIWKLLVDGVLTAVPSKLDGRRKLIPREQVERLLLEEGYRPRQADRRSPTSVRDSELSVPPQSASRPWPRSIGMVSDGTLSSDESEDYMRRHLHADSTGSE